MRKKTTHVILRSILLIGLFFANLNGAVLSDRQLETLKTVRDIALQYPNKQGETFEDTAMAICLTETSAGIFRVGDIGKDPNIFNASLGVMQVRLQTARFLADKLGWKELQEMSDVKLVNKLLGDDKFNATVAVKFIVWLNNHTKHNYFRTVSRYNGGNYNRPYYYRVMKNMELIRNKTDLSEQN